MKNKIILICYTIIQFITGVLSMIFSRKLAETQFDSLMKTINTLPVELQGQMKNLYSVETFQGTIKLFSIILIIFAIILFIILIKNKLGVKKNLAIALTCISIFISPGVVYSIFTLIALVFILRTPKKIDAKKPSKKVTKLEKLKISKKDLLFTVLFVLLYLTQFILPFIFKGHSIPFYVSIIYHLITVIAGFLVFKDRLKRDFKEYKSNVSGYVKESFKWWGILMGCSYAVVIIKLILGGNIVSENQNALNNSPILYVAPLAVLWAPFIEELVFRGSLKRFVKNDVVFIILSAFIFGIAHTISLESGINIIIQSLQYAVMGGIMAIAYTKTNNIFVNMTIHFIQNSFGVLVMLFM